METAQATKHVRRQVFEAASTRRAVRGFRYLDIRRAIEETLYADATFGSGKGSSRTGVNAVPKRQMMAGVGSIDAELPRALELARVATSDAVEHHHRGAGGNIHPAELRRDTRQAEVALDRALQPQSLLDKIRYKFALVPKQLKNTSV